MGISAANSAAKEHRSRIQQGLVSVINGRKLAQEFPKVIDLVSLQRNQVGNRVLLISVVGQPVVGLINPQMLRQEIPPNLQGRNPRRIRLQRQRHQLVKHR